MPQGLHGGILGVEDEKPEVKAPEALAGAEAFAAAGAANASRQDPDVACKPAAFLDHRSLLVETQREHLRDEHELQLAHLRNQLLEEVIRGFGLRLRASFQVFVATVIGVGGAIMIRNAVTSRRIEKSPARVRAGFKHRHARYAA